MPAPRDPVDRIVEAIVAVPVSLFAVARQLVPAVTNQPVRRAHVAGGHPQQTQETAPVISSTTFDRETGVVDRGMGQPTTATLPIDDYDHLAARQIVDRLATLSANDLDAIDAYERAHRRRQTVLHKIAQLR